MAGYAKKTVWPPNPNISSGNNWDRPDAKEYEQAYVAWSLPNDALALPKTAGNTPDPKAVLVRSIMQIIKLREQSRNQYLREKVLRVLESQEHPETTYPEDIDPPMDYAALPPDQPGITSWTFNQWWIEGCRKDYLPLSQLTGWGINRGRVTHTMPKGGPDTTFAPWQLYTVAVVNSPYNPTYWVARAFHFFQLGFFDLALGDAYRAMVLVEVVTDPFKRNKRPGLYNLVHNAVEQHLLCAAASEPEVLEKLKGNFGVPYFLYPLRQAVSHTISLSLIQTESWRDYEFHESYLLGRLIMSEEDKTLFTDRRERYTPVLRQYSNGQSRHFVWRHEMRGGFVAGGQHPQAPTIKRSGHGFRARLTADFVRACEDINGDFLDVRAKSATPGNGPDELGVFASVNIRSNTLIIIDEPNVRGLPRRLETAEVVERVRDYARKYKENAAVAGRPPAIDPECYLCENCFRKPQDSEVLQAYCAALNLPEGIPEAAAATTAIPARGHPDNLCKCVLGDPPIYFCWKADVLEGDDRVATNPEDNSNITVGSNSRGYGDVDGGESVGARDGHANIQVRSRINHQNQQRGGWGVLEPYHADQEGNYRDADDQVVEYKDIRGEMKLGFLTSAGDLWTAEGEPAWADLDPSISSAGDESSGSDGFTGHANRRRKRKAGRQGELARIRLPNGRLTCRHPCSQSGRCKHLCCTTGVSGQQAATTAQEQQPLVDRPRSTCLQVAHSVFHNAACTKQDWRWLYTATQAHWEEHNTILSLLLKEIFDMTLQLHKTTSQRWRLPFEIDPLIGLCGGEDRPNERFPFSWTGNVVVPFDILEALGVNIFANLCFDTWAIQLVLRKLVMNAIPWDPHRRGDTGDIFPPREAIAGPPTAPPHSTSQPPAPTDLRTFLLYSNIALINHACADAANAAWSFDLEERHDGPHQESQPGIPNMILVKTTRDVAAGEEIRVRYFPDEGREKRSWKARRLFGARCTCRKCRDENPAAADEPGTPDSL